MEKKFMFTIYIYKHIGLCEHIPSPFMAFANVAINVRASVNYLSV